MSKLSRFGHGRAVLITATLACVVAGACGEDRTDPKTGSNSNWLVACVDKGECGDDETCLCGACSRECSDDSDCANLQDARCSLEDETATSTQCGTGALAAGLCLPVCSPGSCGAGKSCIDGFCVLAELPASEFCAPVRQPQAAAQMREDEMTTLLQQNRVSGTIDCGEADLAPAPALRLDGRLRCAARSKAFDQAQTGMSGPIDSLGRNAPERITLSGYPFSSWWESYAFAADTVSEAYALLLQDADSCPQLGSSTYSAVGVGNAGDVFVITLASD